MKRNRFIASGAGLMASCLGLAVSGGCSDPSRESGTQVQVTEETKAQIQDMRDTYKDMGDERQKGQ